MTATKIPSSIHVYLTHKQLKALSFRDKAVLTLNANLVLDGDEADGFFFPWSTWNRIKADVFSFLPPHAVVESLFF